MISVEVGEDGKCLVQLAKNNKVIVQPNDNVLLLNRQDCVLLRRMIWSIEDANTMEEWERSRDLKKMIIDIAEESYVLEREINNG